MQRNTILYHFGPSPWKVLNFLHIMSLCQSFQLTGALSTGYSRRPSAEIFYNDPFKIQSYNFRYADRPAYPVQNYQRAQTSQSIQSKPHTFETYYQNPKFNAKNHETRAAAATHSSAFSEYRRRNFLHDFKCFPTQPNRVRDVVEPIVPSGPKSSVRTQPLLRSCCNRDEYQTVLRGQSVTSLKQTSTHTNSVTHRVGGGAIGRSASVCSVRGPAKNSSTSTFQLAPRRSASTCSGCAINININGLDSEAELTKSLKINIQTDACLRNNTDSPTITPNLQSAPRCSGSFIIDKRLSKFSLPEAWVQGSGQYNVPKTERLQLQSEGKRVVQDTSPVRVCKQKCERLAELDRQLDRERLQQLELERAGRSALGLEERRRECEWDRCRSDSRQKHQPMRAISMPTSVSSAVGMTPQVPRRASTDRLPGMAPCLLNHSRAQAARAKRLQSCTRNLTTFQRSKTTLSSQTDQRGPSRKLERRSSDSSNNYNATVVGSGSNCSVRGFSASHLNERKLLNLHVNGLPVSTNQPIYARINNMPIRITTSKPADEDLQFFMNKVRVRNPSPAIRSPLHDGGNSCRSGEQLPKPYNVNISVYADSR
ncbi:PREDICTED: uncharacterized protein LOC108615610 isoform X1 [Drosophila arizonae]|uniref:Uncharacterized protein LOC108615610 isoform X1 n=1 Tax=Drosophila arizonae TaxID=7263 RepID=A0ABM1PES9_DROAR|nr:PREDICTED: uncharacterized protein LOC108615610 isoform X1 [Drosophila arizonae]